MFKNISVLLSFLILTAALSAQQPPVLTTVKNGTLEGYRDAKTGLNIFLGVPFAQPPTGDLRWKAPQPLHNWTGTRSAKKFGPRPVQTNVFGDMIYRSDSMSEDCLYLNIWAPYNKGSRLPVLVYFYGGGFVAGESSEPRYDGAAMAQKGIIAITVNYRLNIFGFFAHPELSREADYKASGNYGLLDQQAALQWVHDNIAAFGGDPDRVTIAGESAGAISVSAQMASPLSKGLFAGAIGESGAAIYPTLPPVPLDSAEAIGKTFADQAGYPTLKELRSLSTAALFQLYNDAHRFGFPVVLDGYFLPNTLPQVFEARRQAMVPLLVGWNSAETGEGAFLKGLPPTKENFTNAVKENFPADFEKVLSVFPHNNADEIRQSAANIASDRFIVYSTWKWFDLHRKNSNQKVYRYLFSKINPNNLPADKQPIGASHASDIPYCMGNLYLLPQIKWTVEDYKTSETFLNYFANFIKSSDPNGKGLPEWPAVKANEEQPPVMNINTNSKKTVPSDQRFQFWEAYFTQQAR
ncbi:carboxylesterase [Niabella ginsenosidivorans]|uniref:Carboxylic ester hydrolase n=1 Tax=Niabella ginsenosidivorans TaxID=1176587 RepID=A0A1A9HXN2_9BACT|nr:carboxylesterase family protein [Niabella ginsenosidivorans]ANH80137.1 carboxylesterase [Niabella ginsenosidivorans]